MTFIGYFFDKVLSREYKYGSMTCTDSRIYGFTIACGCKTLICVFNPDRNMSRQSVIRIVRTIQKQHTHRDTFEHEIKMQFAEQATFPDSRPEVVELDIF